MKQISYWDIGAWAAANEEDRNNLKWWQFRKKKKLDKIAVSLYFAMTHRPEKAIEILTQ